MKDDDRIGDRFQELTGHARTRLGGGARPARRPASFKEYPGAETVAVSIKGLPEGSLWKALAGRRSRRDFTGEPISLEALSRLIFAAQGATARAGQAILRTAPSAGALYPVETYVLANAVQDVRPGLYHYNIQKTVLETVRLGALGRELSNAALGQGMCGRSSATFIFTAAPDRCKWKYAQRAYRYIYMDAGHICANLYLAAQDLTLGCCAMGAFYDDEVNALVGVDGQSETAVYLAAVGPVKDKIE